MNWSLRDLRTVAVNEKLNDDFNADYDPATRLWSFRTRDDADRAEALTAQQKIYILHVPGGSKLWDSFTSEKWGGVAISASNDEGGKKRGVATFVFTDQDRYIDARRHAATVLRSMQSLEGLETANGARAELVHGMTRDDLEHRFATGAITQHTEASLAARLRAIAKRTPPSGAAEKSSIDDAFTMADEWLAVCDRKLAHVANPTPGALVEGSLVGRAPFHIVVDTGTALEAYRSDRIATPKRQQTDDEISFDARSPVNIVFDERGNGHAIQNKDRDDLDVALLKLRGVRHSMMRGEDAILMYDDYYRGQYDFAGQVIGKRGNLAAVYDHGAYLAVINDPSIDVGSEIRRGPRATPLSRTAQRTR